MNHHATFGVTLALVLLTAPLASAQPSPQTRAGVDGVLTSYEQIRVALAQDDASSVAAAARRLQRQASSLANAGGPVGTRMGEAARAAHHLAQADASDLSAVRQAFGALSRPLVSLLDEVPQLRTRRHVFECPMAGGYGRWIQPTSDLSNPYMGQRMATCGRAIH